MEMKLVKIKLSPLDMAVINGVNAILDVLYPQIPDIARELEFNDVTPPVWKEEHNNVGIFRVSGKAGCYTFDLILRVDGIREERPMAWRAAGVYGYRQCFQALILSDRKAEIKQRVDLSYQPELIKQFLNVTNTQLLST